MVLTMLAGMVTMAVMMATEATTIMAFRFHDDADELWR